MKGDVMNPFEKAKLRREGGLATEKQMNFLSEHSEFTLLEIYKMSKAEASKQIGIIMKRWDQHNAEADWESDDK